MAAVETISSLTSAASSKNALTAQPSKQDVIDFKAMMNEANPVNNSVKMFVENAQDKLKIGESSLSSKLKSFDTKDNVMALIEATHQSSMNSISVQLTSKIGSKVSESFEQLVKQQ